MFCLVLVVLAMMLAGCGTKDITAPAEGKGGGLTTLDFKPRVLTTAPIHAGNSGGVGEIAGQISVWDTPTAIYINFETTGGWEMSLAQAHVDDDLVGDWIHDNGTPVPGQFDYHASFDPRVTTHTFEILKADYNFSYGQAIYVIAHCDLHKVTSGGTQTETGFGGDIPGPGPRWWWYMYYTLDDQPPIDPPLAYMEETAMMRMYDNPIDFTYRWVMGNGKNHPWFGYVKTYPVLAPQTYYFYAGQSYKCGEVQIWKEGGFLKVQLDMMNNWQVTGTHLDVSLQGFVGSPAFGLFPYAADHSLFATTYTYNVPWNSDWDGMQLNICLHGDARRPALP